MKILTGLFLLASITLFGCSSSPSDDDYLKRSDSSLSKPVPKGKYEPMQKK